MTLPSRRTWDIAPPLHPGSPVFASDAPFRIVWAARIAPGCPVNVSTLTLSPHTGVHADAQLQDADDGAAMGAEPLEPDLGPCRVIHAIGCAALVQWQHIAQALAGRLPRVLVRIALPLKLVAADASPVRAVLPALA